MIIGAILTEVLRVLDMRGKRVVKGINTAGRVLLYSAIHGMAGAMFSINYPVYFKLSNLKAKVAPKNSLIIRIRKPKEDSRLCVIETSINWGRSMDAWGFDEIRNCIKALVSLVSSYDVCRWYPVPYTVWLGKHFERNNELILILSDKEGMPWDFNY